MFLVFGVGRMFGSVTRLRAAAIIAALLICLSGVGLSFCAVHSAETVTVTGKDTDGEPTDRADSGGTNTEEKTELCIVMYHGLVKDRSRQNRYMIDPQIFENDLKYLTENGYHTITASELVAHFKNGTPLPDKPVMLTFDDGYYNNYLYAYPLLRRYNCSAVLSPIGKACAEAQNDLRQDPDYSQCTLSQISEMSGSGYVEIAYHSYDLHSIGSGAQGVQKRAGESGAEYEKRLKEDIGSFMDCMSGVSDGIVCFTYPYGAKSAETEAVVRAAGFECAMDCEEKMNHLRSAEDLFSLHRFLRDGETSSEDFFGARIKSLP